MTIHVHVYHLMFSKGVYFSITQQYYSMIVSTCYLLSWSWQWYLDRMSTNKERRRFTQSIPSSFLSFSPLLFSFLSCLSFSLFFLLSLLHPSFSLFFTPPSPSLSLSSPLLHLSHSFLLSPCSPSSIFPLSLYFPSLTLSFPSLSLSLSPWFIIPLSQLSMISITKCIHLTSMKE